MAALVVETAELEAAGDCAGADGGAGEQPHSQPVAVAINTAE
jgi:hypothetical protein